MPALRCWARDLVPELVWGGEVSARFMVWLLWAKEGCRAE